MITATLNGVPMPRIQRDFINTPQENAVDVVPLSGDVYVDFVSVENTWTFNYEVMTKDEYDGLRAIYNSQFTDYEFPLLSIPFYGLVDAPVRMSINEKNIWNNCGDIQGAQFTFRVTNQQSEGS